MDKSLLSGRLNKAAIIITFLPSAAFSVYSVLVFTGALSILNAWISGSTFGIAWCFFSLTFAFAALWYHKVGSILIILAGAFFFFTAWTTNHYPQIYLSVAGVYTVGGILHFVNAFFLEKRKPLERRGEKSSGGKRPTTKQIIYIAGFVAFGLGVGFWSVWHTRYDTPLFLNMPGEMIGDAFHGMWVRFISDTIPWILNMPQVFVFTSVLFWGVVGTLFSIFLKPKLIAWIMGVYLVIFGGFTAWFYWG